MATLKQLYARIFGGDKLTLRVDTWREFENLRIQLAKEHRTPFALDLTTDSLCSSYDKDTQTATYWLGPSRRKKAKDWEILDDSPIPESVARDSEADGSNQDQSLGSVSSDVHQSNPQGEIPS